MVYETKIVTVGLEETDAEWLLRLVLDSNERIGAEEHAERIVKALDQSLNPTILC